MKTTRKQALKFYNIANIINPFEYCSFDKEEEIKEIMTNTLEENIKYLNNYITEYYSNIELLENTILLRKYLNLINEINSLKVNYKILKSGLYQINKKNLPQPTKEEKERAFKNIIKKNDINIIKLVKENKYYYYFYVEELF